MRLKRTFAAKCLIALLTLTSAAVPWQPALATTQRQAQDQLSSCTDVSEEDLRAELNTIAQQVFADGDTKLDLTSFVAEQWDAQALDDVVDAVVADAVATVRADEDLWSTFLSGWSAAKAETLTRAVAERAFGAERFRLAMEQLSTDVAVEIEAAIGALSAESVTYNLICLQEFVNANYSGAIVRAFEDGIRSSIDDTALVPEDALDVSILDVLSDHQATLGGVGVIIAAQVAKRLVQRLGRTIARRVAGKVVGRVLGRVGATVIPLAGWIIGGGLIVYDLWESQDGALPEIEAVLTSVEIKSTIQREIVDTIEPELQRELPQMAREVANDLFLEWLDFQRKYRQVLEWSDADEQFASVLEEVEDISHAAEMLDAMITALGVDAMTQSLSDGTFARLLGLPAAAAELLAATGDLQAVLAWGDVAGDRLDAVVALEIFRTTDAAQFDSSALTMLVELEDREAALKLARLSPAALQALDALSRANLLQLSRHYSSEELAWLADALAPLRQDERDALITELVNQPQRITTLQRDGVLNAIRAGDDLGATLAFLDGPADLFSAANDLLLLVRGDISLRLMAAKYGLLPASMLVLLPVLVIAGVAYTLLAIILRPFIGLARLFKRRDP